MGPADRLEVAGDLEYSMRALITDRRAPPGDAPGKPWRVVPCGGSAVDPRRVSAPVPTTRNPARRFKDAIYDQFARVAKALASPHRIEILELLAQGPRTVEVLGRMADMSLANTSAHLRVLRGAGLLEATKDGLYVTYRLADPGVAELLLSIRRTAERRLAEVSRITRDFLAENALLEAVDEAALRRKVRKGEVTLLDVRPPEEFEAAHIPGALSVPLPELARRLSELPRGREVVAYCRGPYCVLAMEAVKALRRKGFKAARLGDGILDWAALGLPVEKKSA